MKPLVKMRPLFVLAMLAALTVFAAADSVATQDEAQVCLEAAKGGTLAQQQSCCKANKGICGCRAGKIVCCDKTFAEGCPCNREDDPLISS